MSYVFTILLLGSLIFLHELGHFLAAKWCNIPIATFSIGFGKKIWGFRWGNTQYQVAMIPLGGYVLPAIESDELLELPAHRQILFALGGPLMNIVAAFASIVALNVALDGLHVETVFIQPFLQTQFVIREIFVALISLMHNPEALSGVFGIMAAGGKLSKESLDWLDFCIMLNLNLAIFNLLPMLPLDGGRIVMAILQQSYAPLRRLQMPFALAGWLIMFGLMIYTTTLDISKLLQSIMV